MLIFNKLKTLVYNSSVKLDLLIHISFVYARIACFCYIFVLYDYGISRFRTLIGKVDDFTYNVYFNLYLEFLFIYSILMSNIYGYYLCAAVCLHNSALFIIIVSSPGTVYGPGIWVCVSFIAGFFILECFVTLYCLYVRRFENNNELFKKIGANPKINQAFATRKQLELFGSINVFTSTVILLKFLLPPSSIYANVTYLTGIFSFTSYLQQALIAVNLKEELVRQRQLAIFLSFIKIGLAITIIVLYNRYSLSLDPLDQPSKVIQFLFGDIIVITSIMTYLLIRDLQQFGSGLKEFLKFKTKVVSLD